MKPRVAGSVTSPVAGSTFVRTAAKMTSGRLNVARLDEDQRMAQMELRAHAAERALRSALDQDGFVGERLLRQA